MRDLLDNLLVESLDELGYPRDMSTYKVIFRSISQFSLSPFMISGKYMEYGNFGKEIPKI